MNACPFCRHENIPGADECSHCLEPLVFLSKPQARTPLERSILKDRVAILGPREPVLVHRDISVCEALRRLVNWKIGSLLVVDGNEQLVGIFTERDALLRIGVSIDEVADAPVAAFMTPSPVTINEDDPIALALQKMDLGGYRHLPVMRDDGVVGVISIRDILQYCAQKLLQEQV
jgi:CBS domain-containing protein